MRPLLCLFLISLSQPAEAWGPEGHRLVARIADSQLSALVRARVLEILGPSKAMASVASFADQVRSARPPTAPWHFIDIPLDKPRLDMERDCAKGNCIVSAIVRLRQALRDPATDAAQRTEALMFLIHFVGDLHQPLHCSDNHDRGGNDVHVQFHDNPTNLHSLWDSGLLGQLPAEDLLFPDLSSESAKHRKGWSKGTVTNWAEEAHGVGTNFVYNKLPPAAAGTPVMIDAAYEAEAGPIIRDGLERAGARLATVLNSDLK